MNKKPDFDVEAAHRYFAAHCFNTAWDLMEKADRTPEEDRQMVALNHASLYHWSQRPDCDSKRLSIGYWQASRIHALLGNAQEARRYAEVCLGYSRDLEPFYLGYAYEALTRAEKVGGNASAAAGHLAKARSLLEQVKDKEDRELLSKDLASFW